MTTWTPEEDNVITTFWTSGDSFSQIAVELVAAGFAKRTRNAVIGRAHRIGLKRERQPARLPRPRAARPKREPTPAKASRLPPAPPAVEEPRPVIRPDRPGVSLRDLDAAFDFCRWPLWPDTASPTADGMTFCGAFNRPGHSYCAYHCTVAYVPAGERRRAA